MYADVLPAPPSADELSDASEGASARARTRSDTGTTRNELICFTKTHVSDPNLDIDADGRFVAFGDEAISADGGSEDSFDRDAESESESSEDAVTDGQLATAAKQWHDATVGVADRVKGKFEQSKFYADVYGVLY